MWSAVQAREKLVGFPPWGVALCISLVVVAVLPVPVVFMLRYFNVIDDGAGGISAVSYKKGHIIKESAGAAGEGDGASLLHAKTTPSEAPSPTPANGIYRKQSGGGGGGGPESDAAPNGRYGIGYPMADMPDMPESDL